MSLGIAITDRFGRRILSSQFTDTLSASLAIDACSTTTQSFVTVAGFQPPREDQNVWEDSDETRAARKLGPKGLGAVQLIRNDIRYISPLVGDIDPIFALEALQHFHSILGEYLDGPVTEGNIKDNFDIVLVLLEEILSNGRSQLTDLSELKEFVAVPNHQLFAAAFSAVNGLLNQTTSTNTLLTSPVPWRATNIRHSSNEFYVDIIEKAEFIIDKQHSVLSGEIMGALHCKSKLSRMPEISLKFSDYTVLKDPSFHTCVRRNRWEKDHSLIFVPPDGKFELAKYEGKAPQYGKARSSQWIPLTLNHSTTVGKMGGTVTLSLTSKAPPSSPITNISVQVPLENVNAAGLVTTVSGGALLSDSNGRPISGGGGKCDVVADSEQKSKSLVWKIKQLVMTDRPAVLEIQYNADQNFEPSTAIVDFDMPSGSFTGLRVNSLVVLAETYHVYKGVRSQGHASLEYRLV